MRLQLLVVPLVILSLIMNHPVVVFAQACQSVAGTWTDNYNFVWRLTQTSGTHFVSGTVDTNCATGWNVTGGVNSFTGGFEITATGSGCTATWFRYTGSDTQPGCYQGSGTWDNDGGPGASFTWSKSCDSPTGESTVSVQGWSPTYPTAYDFTARLATSSSLLFGGRTVEEAPYQTGSDTCYFSGSQYSDFSSGIHYEFYVGRELVQ